MITPDQYRQKLEAERDKFAWSNCAVPWNDEFEPDQWTYEAICKGYNTLLEKHMVLFSHAVNLRDALDDLYDDCEIDPGRSSMKQGEKYVVEFDKFLEG